MKNRSITKRTGMAMSVVLTAILALGSTGTAFAADIDDDSPVMTVTVTTDSESYSAGDEAVFTIEVDQTAEGQTAENVEVSDYLPDGLTLTEVSLEGVSGEIDISDESQYTIYAEPGEYVWIQSATSGDIEYSEELEFIGATIPVAEAEAGAQMIWGFSVPEEEGTYTVTIRYDDTEDEVFYVIVGGTDAAGTDDEREPSFTVSIPEMAEEDHAVITAYTIVQSEDEGASNIVTVTADMAEPVSDETVLVFAAGDDADADADGSNDDMDGTDGNDADDDDADNDDVINGDDYDGAADGDDTDNGNVTDENDTSGNDADNNGTADSSDYDDESDDDDPDGSSVSDSGTGGDTEVDEEYDDDPLADGELTESTSDGADEDAGEETDDTALTTESDGTDSETTAAANLSIGVTADASSYERGANAVFTIKVAQTIEGGAENGIVIYDSIPEGATVTDAALTGVEGYVAREGNAVAVAVDSLSYGEEAVVTIAAVIDDDASGTYTNTASAYGSNTDEVTAECTYTVSGETVSGQVVDLQSGDSGLTDGTDEWETDDGYYYDEAGYVQTGENHTVLFIMLTGLVAVAAVLVAGIRRQKA